MTADEQATALRDLASALDTVPGGAPGSLVTELCDGGEQGRPWLYVINTDACQGTGIRVVGGRYQTLTGLDIGAPADLPAVAATLLADIGWKTDPPPPPGEDDIPAADADDRPAGFLA